MTDTPEPSTYNPLIASDVEWLKLAVRELGLELLFYGTLDCSVFVMHGYSTIYRHPSCTLRRCSAGPVYVQLPSSPTWPWLTNSCSTLHLPSRRHSRLLPAALVALFASSTLAVAANFLFYLVQFSLVLSVKEETPTALLIRLDIMTVVADRFNVRSSNDSSEKRRLTNTIQYVVSDVIVVWRAWVLWSANRIVRRCLIVCLTLTCCAYCALTVFTTHG